MTNREPHHTETMPTIDLDNCRHLQAALGYAPNGAAAGTCFQRAAALMLDLPGAVLVFGHMPCPTPAQRAQEPRASDEPFIHAWVEFNGALYAPSLVESIGLRPISPATYYAANRPVQTWRLSHPAFMQVARRYKLSASIRHGGARAASAAVTAALLDAAGVRYAVSADNGVIPAPAAPAAAHRQGTP